MSDRDLILQLDMGDGVTSSSSKDTANRIQLTHQQTESTETEDEDGPIFEVQAVVGYKKVRGVEFWKVRWANFGSKDDTWEPRENLLGEKVSKMCEEFTNGLVKKHMKRTPQSTGKLSARKGRRSISKPAICAKISSSDLSSERSPPPRRRRGRSLALKATQSSSGLSSDASPTPRLRILGSTSKKTRTPKSTPKATQKAEIISDSDDEERSDSNSKSWFGIKKDDCKGERKRLFVPDRRLSATEMLLSKINSSSGSGRVLRNQLRKQSEEQSDHSSSTPSKLTPVVRKRISSPPPQESVVLQEKSICHTCRQECKNQTAEEMKAKFFRDIDKTRKEMEKVEELAARNLNSPIIAVSKSVTPNKKKPPLRRLSTKIHSGPQQQQTEETFDLAKPMTTKELDRITKLQLESCHNAGKQLDGLNKLIFTSKQMDEFRHAVRAARDIAAREFKVQCITKLFVDPLCGESVSLKFGLCTPPMQLEKDETYVLLLAVADNPSEDSICSISARMWGRSPVLSARMNDVECLPLKQHNPFAFQCSPIQGENSVKMDLDSSVTNKELVVLTQLVLLVGERNDSSPLKPVNSPKPVAQVYPLVPPR